MTQAARKIPGLFEGGRDATFILLLGVTLIEVLAQVGVTALLKLILTGRAEGPPIAFAVIGTGGVAVVFAWLRQVAAEDFGQAYVNQLRLALGHHALAVAGGGGPGRFGTLAIRMTGDLAAMKDWVSKGVCGGIAGVLSLFGAVAAGWIAAGQLGLTAVLVGPVLALFICAGLYFPLLQRIRARRRSRGRLSAKIGDLLLWAGASTAYGAERRAVRPITRTGEEVLQASVSEARILGLLQMPAFLTLPLGIAAAVLLMSTGTVPAYGVAGWAALLFALSLASLALSMIIGAIVQYAERQIAMARLLQLMDDSAQQAPAAPQGKRRLPPGKGSTLQIGHEVLVTAGDQIKLSRAQFSKIKERVLSGAEDILLDGVKAERFSSTDWARRVAYAGPSRPLPRARLAMVLAAKRRASPRAMEAALQLVGLPVNRLEEDEILDPHSPTLEEWDLARLRLARALCHKPRIVIIDDMWLSSHDALMHRVRQWLSKKEISLIEVVHDVQDPKSNIVPLKSVK